MLTNTIHLKSLRGRNSYKTIHRKAIDFHMLLRYFPLLISLLAEIVSPALLVFSECRQCQISNGSQVTTRAPQNLAPHLPCPCACPCASWPGVVRTPRPAAPATPAPASAAPPAVPAPGLGAAARDGGSVSVNIGIFWGIGFSKNYTDPPL